MKKDHESQGPEIKSRYRQIIDGDAEPIGHEKGYVNLEAGRRSFNQMTPEEAREIRRKGAEAVNRLHGEKKTARESLERILTLRITDGIAAGADLPPDIVERLRRDNPEATLYDLIQAVAVGRALDGSIRAAEYIRDTHGDKPVEKASVDINGVMTDQDREMLARIADRLEAGDRLEVVRDV